MDRAVLVYVDLDGVQHLTGRLWSRARRAVRPRHSNTPTLGSKAPCTSLWSGWRLSPAYDLNPVPVDLKPRILTTAINEDDATASLALAMEVAPYFELDEARARAVAASVGRAVSTWRDNAARLGLTKAEINGMASAFEHADLKEAVSFNA